ncbi:MAG TPA: hypothetical protein VN898_06530, partial [Candidatus Binatia bacterium]|nr:hypothetical protein [Candidatus Binatia bacterium]
RLVREDWRRTLRDLPMAMCLGVGLSLSNSRAIAAALLGLRREFARTPKHRLVGRSGRRERAVERTTAGRPWRAVELLAGAWFAGAAAWAMLSGHYAPLPLFLLFLAGCLVRPILVLAEKTS